VARQSLISAGLFRSQGPEREYSGPLVTRLSLLNISSDHFRSTAFYRPLDLMTDQLAPSILSGSARPPRVQFQPDW